MLSRIKRDITTKIYNLFTKNFSEWTIVESDNSIVYKHDYAVIGFSHEYKGKVKLFFPYDDMHVSRKLRKAVIDRSKRYIKKKKMKDLLFYKRIVEGKYVCVQLPKEDYKRNQQKIPKNAWYKVLEFRCLMKGYYSWTCVVFSDPKAAIEFKLRIT